MLLIIGASVVLLTMHLWWTPVFMFFRVLWVLTWSLQQVIWRDVKRAWRTLGPNTHPGPVMRRPNAHVDVTAALQELGLPTDER